MATSTTSSIINWFDTAVNGWLIEAGLLDVAGGRSDRPRRRDRLPLRRAARLSASRSRSASASSGWAIRASPTGSACSPRARTAAAAEGHFTHVYVGRESRAAGAAARRLAGEARDDPAGRMTMADEMTGRLRLRQGALHGAGSTNDEAYLCHCRMCQRATGSVSIAFKNVMKADVAWESEPDWYQSSPIAARPYCAACGTSLGFAFPDSDEDGPDRRLVRRSVALPARPPFRRGEHAPRLAQHRGPAGNAQPRIISRWSSTGSKATGERCRTRGDALPPSGGPDRPHRPADRFDRLRHRPAGAAGPDRPSRARSRSPRRRGSPATCWSLMPARNSSPGRCSAISATASGGGRSCSSRRSPSRSIIC